MAIFVGPSRIGAGVSLGTLYIRMALDPTQMQQGLRTVVGDVEDSSSAMLKAFNTLALTATAVLAGVAAGAVNEFAKFDKAMTSSTAIMGDLTEEMKKKMADLARELSLHSDKSAADLAGTYLHLASAGYTAEQAMAALPTVMKFATAGAFDLKDASTLLSDAQVALGLRMDDATKNMENMTRVADVLTRAEALANASTKQFAEALTNKAAAAMRQFGVSLEEGVAVLAAFANQGLKGEAAGTALYIVLRDLQKAALHQPEAWSTLGVAVYDASGNMRHMADIIDELSKALVGASDEQKRMVFSMLGFTDRSLSATMSLLGMGDAIRKYEEGLLSAGGATEKVAGKQLVAFQDQLLMVWHEIQNLAIEIGKEMAPSIIYLGKEISKLARYLLDLQKQMDYMKPVMEGVMNLLKAFVVSVALVYATLRSFSDFVKLELYVVLTSLQMITSGTIKIFTVWVDVVANALIPALMKLGNSASTVGKLMMDLFLQNWNVVIEDSRKLSASVGKDLEKLSKVTGEALVTTTEVAQDTVKALLKNAVGATNQTTADLEKTWTGVLDLFKHLYGEVGTTAPKTTSALNGTAAASNALGVATGAAAQGLRGLAEANKAVSSTATTATVEVQKLINSANLSRVLASQGFGDLADKKTGDMTPNSFEKSVMSYRQGTRGIGERSGATDPYTAELDKYNDQIKTVQDNLRELQTYQDKDVLLTVEAQKKKAAAIEAYNNRLKALQQAQNLTILQAGQNMFDSLAEAAEGFAGKQSEVYMAMFAASKAFAIAESIIKIQQGIANAASMPFPANIAAIASVVAATANIVTTISSIGLNLQGREKGGPVSRNTPYIVGEKGKELFVPDSNGTIIPNNRLTGSTIVNVHNYTDAQAQVTERQQGNDRIIDIVMSQVNKTLASDIRNGKGDVPRALAESFRLRRGKSQ